MDAPNERLVFHSPSQRVLHLRGSFPCARLSSGPLHPGGLYLGWRQGPTPSTAFGDRIGSSPPPGVEPVSMTIGPQDPYQRSRNVTETNNQSIINWKIINIWLDTMDIDTRL
ncbi:hypothetical protein YC2023_113331 [Brassica napus]